MSTEQTDAVQRMREAEGGRTMLDVLDELMRFDGSPEQFLSILLALQCHAGGADRGVILRVGTDGQVDVLAVQPALPPGTTAPVWLAQAVESAPEAIAAGRAIVKPVHAAEDLYGQPARLHTVLVPLRVRGGLAIVAAFVVPADDMATLATSRERLEMTLGFLSLYEMRLTLQRRQADLVRVRTAMEILAAVNEQDRFMAAAMVLTNETAARWGCERVSLGFLKGRYVHLRAMSHTEKFSRKMKLVQDVEAAMEECLDQDVEVVFPAEAETTTVSRVAAELSKRHGPTAVLSLPIRKGGEVRAVLLLERPPDRPFNLYEVESVRLVCELCTARMVGLEEHDRWFGARAAAGVRTGLAGLLGAEHTWKKLLVILGAAVVVFLVVAKGRFTAEAPFKLEAVEHRVVPAPFDGYLSQVFVSPNDDVEGGKTVLAELDTAELRLRLAAMRAERATYLKQADAAARDDKRAEAQIAHAQAQRAAAQIELLDYKLNQARITAPISGKVVVGDLKRQIGAPVKTGDVLFEVAAIESIRAEMSLPEDQIADVVVAQQEAAAHKAPVKGQLATASYPDQRFEFAVERVHPVAEVDNQKNVFKVRVRLLKPAAWMRPGMQGIAKIDLGRRRYAWIWTRRLVNWVRMKLWV